MRSFQSLSEHEILALAISLEEEDARIYGDFAEGLKADYPATAAIPERTKSYEPERGPRPEVGYIGLQNHDDFATGTQVYFKEVSVRPL